MRFLMIFVLLGVIAAGYLLTRPHDAVPVQDNPPGKAAAETAYDFGFTDINGAPLPLQDYKGKVLLIVNIASDSRFAEQLAGLEVLYEAFKDRGFVVIGVPSNDFGGEEPLHESEIQQLIVPKYNITFPLTEKTAIAGEEANPFFRWASRQSSVNPLDRNIFWNFHKLLINRRGQLVDGFLPVTPPDGQDIIGAIEAALKPQPQPEQPPQPRD